MRILFVTSVLLAFVLGPMACSDDHTHTHEEAGGHTSPYPTCDAIIKRCHPLDVGEGPIHDCHEVAHSATNDDSCIAKRDACFATCVAGADAGTTADASSSDGATDASSD